MVYSHNGRCNINLSLMALICTHGRDQQMAVLPFVQVSMDALQENVCGLLVVHGLRPNHHLPFVNAEHILLRGAAIQNLSVARDHYSFVMLRDNNDKCITNRVSVSLHYFSII